MVADRAQHKPDQGTKKDDIETSPDANITLDSTTTSDIESGERPVREKLKKTSITPASANSKTPFKRDRTTQFVNNEIIPALSEDTGVDMNESLQLEDSKLERKRSHDDMESDDPEALDGDRRGSDPRKRSRESSMDGDANSNRLGRAARHSSASRSPSEEHGNSASVFTGVEGEDGTLQVKELSTAQDDTMTGRIDTEIDEEDAASEITDCVGPEFIKSPKNKRSRDEYIRDNDRASLSQNASLSEVHVPVTKQEDKHAPTDRDQTVAEEPNPKRHRDSNSPQADDTNKPPTGTDTEKRPPTGPSFQLAPGGPDGLTKNNVVETSSPSPSPFASQAPRKGSPFSTLGLASGKSSFAALAGKSSSMGFGFGKHNTTAAPNNTASLTQATSVKLSPFSQNSSLDSALGTSQFGKFGSNTAGKGFGGLDTGLSSGFGTGPAGGITGLSVKAAKPFGTTLDEADEDDGDVSASEEQSYGFKSPRSDEGSSDKRFYAQNVETGEEDEESIFTCRAKLYSFVKVAEDKKEWKEKGLGYLKLNVKRPATDGDEHETKRARFIMRADGSHRVVLNTPVQKELRVGNSKGDAPSGGYIYFWGSVDSKPQLELLQLKMKQPLATQLYQCIQDLQTEM